MRNLLYSVFCSRISFPDVRISFLLIILFQIMGDFDSDSDIGLSGAISYFPCHTAVVMLWKEEPHV